jgi:hypothetical protein
MAEENKNKEERREEDPDRKLVPKDPPREERPNTKGHKHPD